MPSSSCLQKPLQNLLDAARPFLRRGLETVIPRFPSLVAILWSAGTGECSHKQGCFLDHLVDIYRILKLWCAPDPVALCGLFHSAYSVSHVNLVIFDPSIGRDVVRRHVGSEDERLVHLFFVVPHHTLVHDDLLFHYSDDELVQHLQASEVSRRTERSLFS